MKKLQDYNGGHELSIDDLTWLQTAILEALTGLCSVHGDNFIISGCEKSDTTIEILGVPVPAYAFSAGWICIDGEICKFDGQTILADDYDNASISLQETNQAPQVLYKDGNLRDVYKVRKAHIENVAPDPGNLESFDTGFRYLAPTAWQEVDTVAGATFGQTLRVRRHYDHLEIQGNFTVAVALGGTGKLTDTALPKYLRPNITAYIMVQAFALNSDATDAVRVRFETDGHIYLPSTYATGAGRQLYFNGLRVPLVLAFG